MSERLTKEQAASMRDAIAIVRLVKGNGHVADEWTTQGRGDMEALLDDRTKDEITVLLGHLLAMAAMVWTDEMLDEMALSALDMQE